MDLEEQLVDFAASRNPRIELEAICKKCKIVYPNQFGSGHGLNEGEEIEMRPCPRCGNSRWVLVEVRMM